MGFNAESIMFVIFGVAVVAAALQQFLKLGKLGSIILWIIGALGILAYIGII